MKGPSMQWKEYRLLKTRVATGDADGSRRVLELLDGRTLIEREGAPSQIVSLPFEQAKDAAESLARVVRPVRWWLRLWLYFFGGRS